MIERPLGWGIDVVVTSVLAVAELVDVIELMGRSVVPRVVEGCVCI